MGELRKDYILDRWVIIAPKRGERPHDFTHKVEASTAVCPFCPGNEHLTAAEIGRLGNWRVRWFFNKFPAVVPGTAKIETHNRFYTFSIATGAHEVIVETPDHRQLAELEVNEIAEVLHVYEQRVRELAKKHAYVAVFKNSGPEAGASVRHSHSQIIAFDVIPSEIRELVDAQKKFITCPWCDIIAREKDSERRCFENEDWIAFTPYASRFQYECWIMPKKHLRTFNDVNLDSLAPLLKRVLGKIAPHAYNITFTYAPGKDDLHFRVAVLPRSSIFSGFEHDTGIIINTVSPEDAARYYRES